MLSQPPSQPPTPLIAVSFARLPPGWRQFPGTGSGLATSWAYRQGPVGWALSIPRNGIAVNVFFVRDTPPNPPLRLHLPASTKFTLDGAPDTPEYRIHGRVRQHNVEVWVDIRRSHPTTRQLRLAQQAVSALRFK
jgi:hypothetical protein